MQSDIRVVQAIETFFSNDCTPSICLEIKQNGVQNLRV